MAHPRVYKFVLQCAEKPMTSIYWTTKEKEGGGEGEGKEEEEEEPPPPPPPPLKEMGHYLYFLKKSKK